MKSIYCPLNGWRALSEFRCDGPVRPPADGKSMSETAWWNHLTFHECVAGERDEWWVHLPSSNWFIMRRNLDTDTVRYTWKVEDYPLFGPEAGANARETQS